MRAFEVGLLCVFILAGAVVIQKALILPLSVGTCDPSVCAMQNYLYTNLNSSTLSQATQGMTINGMLSWDTVFFAFQMTVFAIFWSLTILATFVACGPILVIMFNVDPTLAAYLQIGQWILWMWAYVQIKRGQTLDSMR